MITPRAANTTVESVGLDRPRAVLQGNCPRYPKIPGDCKQKLLKIARGPYESPSQAGNERPILRIIEPGIGDILLSVLDSCGFMTASPADADDAALMRLIKPVFSIFMKTLLSFFT